MHMSGRTGSNWKADFSGEDPVAEARTDRTISHAC